MILCRLLHVLLFLVPGLTLAQGVTVAPAPPEETTTEIQPTTEHIDEEDQRLLAELTAEKARAAETAIKLDQAKEDIQNVGMGALNKLQSEGQLSLNGLRAMDDHAMNFLKEKIKEAHLENVPHEKLRAMILANHKGKPTGRLFEKFPALLDTMVDIMRDREALPALVGIANKKDEFQMLFMIWLGLFILSIVIKRYIFPKRWSGLQRFGASLVMKMVFLCISLTAFYLIFEKEVGPSIRVISARIKS